MFQKMPIRMTAQTKPINLQRMPLQKREENGTNPPEQAVFLVHNAASFHIYFLHLNKIVKIFFHPLHIMSNLNYCSYSLVFLMNFSSGCI